MVDPDEAQAVPEDIQLMSHALDALDGEILPVNQEKPVAVCMLPSAPSLRLAPFNELPRSHKALSQADLVCAMSQNPHPS
ncbi:hypothetical protein [Burkholderia gladioli]|uniref:hypothetical protein n=1 Tax=Burkholderia gladioli TaxID=28095 RepID=UPI001640272C|nr:hypothetical protein [Burkholderia gladioli]